MTIAQGNLEEPSVRSKVYSSPGAALADIGDGAVLLVTGFAGYGVPESLLRELQAKGVGNLTCICHGGWSSHSETFGVAQLVASG